MISMNQVWDDSVAFVRRESGLLVPLALATMFVGDVVTTLVAINTTPGEPQGLATVVILAAVVWAIVGQLSIISLVLNAGQSVGEAIAKGLARFGKFALVALVMGFGFSLALIPVSMALVASGFNPAVPETMSKVPSWVSLLLIALFGAMIWLAVRLALMNALIVDRNPGIVEILKRGFALTRGIAARLFLVALLYAVVVVVLGSAVRFVAGSLFALIANALGSPFAGLVMTALVSGLVTTAMSLIATVFLATLYKRVSSGI